MTNETLGGRRLLAKIRLCIESDQYKLSRHFLQRQKERQVTLAEALHVLRHGYHDASKDEWDNRFQSWKYAIQGRSLEGRQLCIAITFFQKENMLLLTTYEVKK